MELLTVTNLRPDDAYYRHLEQGGVVFFPASPFPVPSADQQLLLETAQTAGSHHKNIAYRPAEDRVSNFDSASVGDPERLRAVLRSFSQRTLGFLGDVFPRYRENCRIDYASFRPQEEEGRDLPLNKRNDLLHVDAFPTRPTSGDLILRTFININPAKSRVWLVSDPFRQLAERYARRAGLSNASQGSLRSRTAALLRALGLPLKNRSAYDRFMLRFHDWLKADEEYQRDCPKYRFEFPPGSAWMVFTDVVPHAVLSGRYALEQTIMVRKENLLSVADAPIRILESLCGRQLAI
jgi:3-deoxy-D-manno-oct-2-ulosonic acid (Kdo) hydroxylase